MLYGTTRVAMVDGAWLNPSTSKPGNEYIPRLDKAIQLYTSRQVDRIILMAGKATKGIDIRHCDAGEEYLIQKGVPSSAILKEPKLSGRLSEGSRDTAAEFVINGKYFQNLLKRKVHIILVSSDYHEQRIREVAGTILGKDPQFFGFHGIPRRIHGNYTRQKIHERKSLTSFRKTFRGLKPGNIHQAEKILLNKHPLYREA